MNPEAKAVLEVPECIDPDGRIAAGHDWKTTFVNSHRGSIQIDVICSHCSRLATMRIASRPGRSETKGLRVDLSAPEVRGEFGEPQGPKRTRVAVSTLERVKATDQPCAWETVEPDGLRGCDVVPARLRIVDAAGREFWICVEHARRFLRGEDATVHADPPAPGEPGAALILTAEPEPPPRPEHNPPGKGSDSPATARPRPLIGQPTAPTVAVDDRAIVAIETDKPGRCLVIDHGANCYGEGVAILVTDDDERFGICVEHLRQLSTAEEIAAGWPESGLSYTLFLPRMLAEQLRPGIPQRSRKPGL